MSKETFAWLNKYQLIGMTDERGNAWHYRADLQGEPNHYPGPVPVDDVLRRLFNFEIEKAPIYTMHGDELKEITGKVAVKTSDTGDVLAVFGDGYTPHSYREWLLDNVASLLDDDLVIGSAGLLRNRGVAYVSVELPETLDTPVGLSFRPNLLAATSADGTLSTTYQPVCTVVVCDNTLSAALGESTQRVKIRHTKHSALRINSARDALGIVYSMADSFAAEVQSLADWEVSSKQWNTLLDAIYPVPNEDGVAKTKAVNKRVAVSELYAFDPRACQWNGTALGVLQAYNTWAHHVAPIRGETTRSIRNMENVLAGKIATQERQVLSTLSDICSN